MVFYRIVDIWNGLKEDVVETTSVHNFKEIFRYMEIWRQDTMSPAQTMYNTTR